MSYNIHISLEIRMRHGFERKDGSMMEPKWDDGNYLIGFTEYPNTVDNRKMFVILGNVNNNEGIEHIPHRGFPTDCSFGNFHQYYVRVHDNDGLPMLDSDISRDKAEEYVSQGKSQWSQSMGIDYISDPEKQMANWCTTNEMEDAVNKAFRNDDGSYRDGCDSWLAMVGTMKGYERSGRYECRAIYWFYEIL